MEGRRLAYDQTTSCAGLEEIPANPVQPNWDGYKDLNRCTGDAGNHRTDLTANGFPQPRNPATMF